MCCGVVVDRAVVTTIAGNGQSFADGFGTNARFYYPYGVAVDASGNVFVGDNYNMRIRRATVFAGMAMSPFIDLQVLL
jgi:hypothetical protein